MNVEETLNDIITSAKAGKITNHIKTNETESWIIQGSEEKFRVEISCRTSKTNREFNKNNIFKINPDGTEKQFNLGEWKKKKFYTLVYNLQDGKIFNKIKQDPILIKKISEAIKYDPERWTRTDSNITGTLDGNQYVINRDRKLFDSGKVLYRCNCLQNGQEILKGSQLMKLWK